MLVETYLAIITLDGGIVVELQDVLIEKRLRILQRFFFFCLTSSENCFVLAILDYYTHA